MKQLGQSGNIQLWMCLVVKVKSDVVKNDDLILLSPPEQYCIVLYIVLTTILHCPNTWNVRPLNQGKLEVIKQKMARVNNYIFRNQ